MMSYGGGNDGSGSGGGGGPCGACKFLRRKCIKGCVFAPYFDSEQGTSHFAAVHKVFGASNASKLLLRLPPHLRLDAVITLCYEALARVSDPVYGCVSHIFTLQQQVVNLQAELAYIQARLSTLQGLPLSPESSPRTTTNVLYSRSPDLSTASTSDNMVSRSASTSNMILHRSNLPTTLMSTRANMCSFSSYVPSADHQEYEESDLQTLAREFVNRHLPGVKLGPSSSGSNNKYQVTDSDIRDSDY